ncbi:uracil-DNA glycosylase family protein [Ensifer canadensis]
MRRDLAGRPFVGPAGKLFNAAAHSQPLRSSLAYIINAISEMSGKRHLHRRSDAGEVEIFRGWLDHEFALVKPKFVVALEATALIAPTGERATIAGVRG